jgi:hypothetical protein
MTPAAIRRLQNLRRDLFGTDTSTTKEEVIEDTVTSAA